MVDIVQLDHVTEGLSQLPSQWDNSSKVRALLQSWLEPLNNTEADLFAIRDGFNINTAVGAQLDIIGGYFSEDRLGRSDTDYRNAILTIIATGNGSGTPDQLINLFGSMSNTGTIQYWEHYPLSSAMCAVGGDDGGISDVTYMSSAKPASTEYAALMYDPAGYCWRGAEGVYNSVYLVDNLGNQIIDDNSNNITVNVVLESPLGEDAISSFVDESQDGDTEFGYGINYGGNYGGSAQFYSWLAETSTTGNTLVTSGGNGFVEWAGDDEYDPLTGQTNKAKPPLAMTLSGLKQNQPMSRQYFNWLMAKIDDWLQHFSNRTVVGTVKMTADSGKDETDYETLYGGTWAAVGSGSITLAGETVYLFERTA